MVDQGIRLPIDRMDLSAAQLDRDLSDSVVEALAVRRPILSHLTADSTWLLALPRTDAPSSGRTWFNILIDPWFEGIQVDYYKWFSQQWHVIEPSVRTISDLNDRLKDREDVAEASSSTQKDDGFLRTEENKNPYIDAVIISHEFTDHCNEGTLRQLHSNTPIFAKPAAAKIIRSWCHFSSVQNIPSLASRDLDWRSYTMDSLPPWLAIFRISQPLDVTSTHSAVVICFPSGGERSCELDVNLEASAEAIIYTPHGIPTKQLEILSHAFPSIHSLVLVHGLHEVFLGWFGQINLGAVNGLECQRQCSAKYLVPTHDENKSGKGLIEYVLRRKALTLEDATRQLKERWRKRHPEVDEDNRIDDFNFVELNSGESLILV